MKNLMDAIDECLMAQGYDPISGVINNKEKCVRYINRILESVDNKVVIPFGLALDKYDFRVKHVLFSFGLGVLLAEFCNLDKVIENEYRKYKVDAPFGYIWLTLCIYHDYGYFGGISFLRSWDIDQIALDHSIFDFDFCTSRYSRHLYRAYYRKKYQSQNWDKAGYDLTMNKYEEIGDHGIIGGYLLFDKLYASEQKMKRSSKNHYINKILDQNNGADNYVVCHPERIPLYQDICYRIMEHNIWKGYGDGQEFDEISEKNFIKINTSEPLLFLLSLVDTIEMTKKFCRYTDSGKDKERSVFPKTLGQKVFIGVSSDKIKIYYGELRKFIKEHNFADSITSWEDSVQGLKDWVQIHSEKDMNEIDVITVEL